MYAPSFSLNFPRASGYFELSVSGVGVGFKHQRTLGRGSLSEEKVSVENFSSEAIASTIFFRNYPVIFVIANNPANLNYMAARLLAVVLLQ